MCGPFQKMRGLGKNTPQTECGPSQKVKESERASKYSVVNFYGPGGFIS